MLNPVFSKSNHAGWNIWTHTPHGLNPRENELCLLSNNSRAGCLAGRHL